MKSGFGGGLKRNRVLAEIAANSTTETRVLQLIAANASGGSAVKDYSSTQVATGVDALCSGGSFLDSTAKHFFQTTTTIPADTLEVDDLVSIQAIIFIESNGHPGDLNCTLELAGTVIAQNVSYVPVTGDTLLLKAEGVVTAAGASGTVKFTAISLQSSPRTHTGSTAAGGSFQGGQNGFTNTAALSINTTSTATVQVSAQWDSKNDSKNCELRQLSYTVLAG